MEYRLRFKRVLITLFISGLSDITPKRHSLLPPSYLLIKIDLPKPNRIAPINRKEKSVINRLEKLPLGHILYDLTENNDAQSSNNSSKQTQLQSTPNIHKISTKQGTPKSLVDEIFSFTANAAQKTYFSRIPRTTNTSDPAIKIDTKTSRMGNWSENGYVC